VKFKVNILVSFFNVGSKKIPDLPTFLDSGAYSAFTQKKTIDLKKYITYIKKNKNKFEVYACLDVIGNPEATWRNYQIMKTAGLNPIPTFHVGSDFKHLEQMKNESYIALGGMVPYSTKPTFLIKWLKKCFGIIPSQTKVHAFGMTNPKIIENFPFHSVDSTSWLAGNRYKTMYRYSRGKLKTITVPGFKELNYKKIMAWNLMQWKKYADYLEEKHGIHKNKPKGD
jgi:hypothetical protein